jgi:hypothetical protein
VFVSILAMRVLLILLSSAVVAESDGAQGASSSDPAAHFAALLGILQERTRARHVVSNSENSFGESNRSS